MSKKWIFTFIAVLGLGLAVSYITSAEPPPRVAQPVVQPPDVPFTDYIGGAGLTEPNSENIAIGTQVPGIVREVRVNVGDTVAPGDILFVIDNREAQAGLVQAEAEVARATAELKNREAQNGVVTSIKSIEVISKDEKIKRLYAVGIAKAELEAAKAALESARVNLELHSVVAPVGGVVMTRDLRVGEFAPAGTVTEPLMRLGNFNPMHIRVDIDENDAWRFKEGARAIAFVRGNPQIKVGLNFVRVEPYVRPKRSLTGDSTERVDTRVLQIIYAFDPEAKPIYVGQQMDVYIEAANVN